MQLELEFGFRLVAECRSFFWGETSAFRSNFSYPRRSAAIGSLIGHFVEQFVAVVAICRRVLVICGLFCFAACYGQLWLKI